MRNIHDSHQRSQTVQHVPSFRAAWAERLALLESSWAYLFREEIPHKRPRQSDCSVKRDKRNSTLRYDGKALRLAKLLAKEKTEAFRELYRFRAGAEGTMSDLDRVTGIKQLRVREMRQVRVAAVLKATGFNILRAMMFRNRHRRPKIGNEWPHSFSNSLAGPIKE